MPTRCFTEIQSPVGRLRLVADDAGLRGLAFVDGDDAGRQAPDPSWKRDSARLRDVAAQLDAYFAGELQDFDVPLAPEGTEFQRLVWTALRDIPYGETRSYGEIARAVGKPNASRAVGLANGSNPIAIIVPCHRVIGSSGALVGYGGGLPIKEKLLALERGQERLPS